jgi:hypothetical protein
LFCCPFSPFYNVLLPAITIIIPIIVLLLSIIVMGNQVAANADRKSFYKQDSKLQDIVVLISGYEKVGKTTLQHEILPKIYGKSIPLALEQSDAVLPDAVAQCFELPDQSVRLVTVRRDYGGRVSRDRASVKHISAVIFVFDST